MAFIRCAISCNIKITHQNIKSIGIRLGTRYDLHIGACQLFSGNFLNAGSRQIGKDAILLRMDYIYYSPIKIIKYNEQ